MKKVLCIISALLCILLTACGDATSIGIIGGADGPTSIIVAEKGEKAMFEQITAEELIGRSGAADFEAAFVAIVKDLVKVGYTNVKEFGGIIDWPYEVEK